MASKSHEMAFFGAPAGEDLRALRWPDAARFPLNVGSRRVEEQPSRISSNRPSL
jgi:hypothetical protein